MNKRVIYIILFTAVLLCFGLFQYFSNVKLSIGNDKWLISNHNYIQADDMSQDIYMIYKDNNLIKFERHNVRDEEGIAITVPVGMEFKLSLPSNETLLCKWKIDSEINEQIISYLGDNYIDLCKSRFKIGKQNSEYKRRQNLNFFCTGKGVTIIDLKCIHNETNEIFKYNKIIINVVDVTDLKK